MYLQVFIHIKHLGSHKLPLKMHYAPFLTLTIYIQTNLFYFIGFFFINNCQTVAARAPP